MATNQNGSTTFQEIIDRCLRSLCEENNVQAAAAQSKKIDYKRAEEINQYKLCCYEKAGSSFDFYRKMDLCLATPGFQETEQLIAGINKYVAKDVELTTKIKDAVNALKEVKIKLGEFNDEVCRMDRCIEEEKRCNPKLWEALGEEYGDFESMLGAVKEAGDTTYENAQITFDLGIDLAGMQSFADLETLQTLGANLKTVMTQLKAEVESNTKFADEDRKKILGELKASMNDLAVFRAESCKADAEWQGTDGTYLVLHDPKCLNTEQIQARMGELCSIFKSEQSAVAVEEIPNLKDCNTTAVLRQPTQEKDSGWDM